MTWWGDMHLDPTNQLSIKAHIMISDRVKQARERLGLSQAELAARCGVDQAWVGHIEAGRREPRVDNLRKLAAGLHVSADWLLDLETTGYDEGFRRGAFEAVEAMKAATRLMRSTSIK